jgi:6-phosphogluconolactonase
MMRPLRRVTWAVVAVAALLAAVVPGGAVVAQEAGKAAGNPMIVYVGTYTGPKSKGIYTMRFDPATGRLTAPEVAAEVKNPSFLAIHPSRQFLYAVGELDEFRGKKGGAVSAFTIDPKSGKLTLMNQETTGGNGPCWVAVDATGKAALIANYGGGSISAVPIKPDGSLGAPAAQGGFVQHTGSSVNKSRQSEPHAHSLNATPDNKYAVAADLGLDKLLVYKLDPAAATLTPNDPPFATLAPGTGPRHLAFHPNGKFAFVCGEMGMTVTSLAYDGAKGTLTEVQTISTLPEGTAPSTKYSTAEVQVHPSGKFVYVSNRGHDTIAGFRVEPETGKMTAIGHTPSGGKTPRNFRIDPTGQWLLAANQDSDNVVVFRIDEQTGALSPTGTEAKVGSPVCVKFLTLVP